MKVNAKKVFAAVLALGLIVSAAGCGKQNTAGLDAEGNYEVVWYNQEAPMPDHNLVYEEISKYTKEKIGVTVKYTPFMGSEYGEKMQLLFASGEKIDMCFASNGTKFQQNARQSAYLDMGPLLDSVGKQTKALFPEYALDCYKVGGIQYGIPVLKDWAFQPILASTREKLEAAGIFEEFQNIEKLSDFTPLVEKWRAVPGNEKHYGLLMRGNHHLMKFLPQETIDGSVVAGFTFDNYDKVINVFETPDFMELCKLTREWYNKGYHKNDAATSTSDSDLFKINNFLASHGEWLPYYGVEKDDNDPKKAIYALKLTSPRMATTQVTMCGLAMPLTCVNPERTMEFINLIYNDEYVRNTIGYGIEGKHWVADGEDHFALPEGVEQLKDTGYLSTIAVTGNRYILKVAPNTPADIWEKYQQFNEDSTKSGAIGFSFDPQPVEGQIAAINNVYNEFFKALIVGAVDPETELPKFLKKLEAVGSNDVIAEAQRQYDEWKKIK
ncbi:MAG: ABC transporter substrate-binding protein [Clostridia bacterium]|nr:ABC transporter substrate-binding protein [Clostridia bacterium]